jgi:hypothetical protein
MSKAGKSKVTGKHLGKLKKDHRFPALRVTQSGTTLYLFKASASRLFKMLSINRREENKGSAQESVKGCELTRLR